MKIKIKSSSIIILLLLGISLIAGSSKLETFDEPIAHLKLIINGPTDYGSYISKYLEALGIELEIKTLSWSLFVDALINTHNFDLVLIGITNGGTTPDERVLFTEQGAFNMFGLSSNIPYQNESEVMQELSVSVVDLYERQQLLFDWQQLVMDRIIPILPLHVAKSYVSLWNTTKGYDYSWGLANSLPYMYNDGLHEGQMIIDEWNQANTNWIELNPLYTDDLASKNIWDLCSDPILMWSPDQIPIKTGLVYDWEQIGYNHIKFYLRDNVFWNPSFNVTERNIGSAPLITETSLGVWEVTDPGILMTGLKDGSVSNGTNQQVTAKDAVFTYLAWSNLNVSEQTEIHEFITDIFVDPVDDLAFHIFVDGDPDTPEIEPYVDFFSRLNHGCLPEFFLNSTNSEITFSSGGIKTWGLYNDIQYTPQWKTFSDSCFGHGKYMLDYYVENSITIHTRSPFWHGIGAKDGTTDMNLFFEKINTHCISDFMNELDAFKAGELDISGVTQFPQERKLMQADIRFNVQSELYDHLPFLAFNLRRPFIGGADNQIFLSEPGKTEYTKSCAVRKAICYAINREEMNTEIHDGEYLIAHSCLYPYTAFYYYDDVIKYEYNLDKAREWLAVAGYIKTETTNVITFSSILALLVLQISISVRRRKNK
ncbi:MAG: hypothetical protein H7645_05175 [Candidatus Heimdallarchaeota archaeon]|nr:hypothetical protein [Candidatus Heimdallarchaeota archaeon]MCK4769713.1 hypothetical protein [Candidatus Heimdallarchaeota archaeon]